MRAATPGTLLVLGGAVLLVLVTLSTPIIKSIYFLRATIGGSGDENGQVIMFGSLGYCIASSCSKPKLGYTFNPNQLLGINIISAKYTEFIVKGLTYTLILHPVALVLAAVSVLFGIVAHCREASMNCCSTLFASMSAAVALVAFGLDLALFLIARKRINAIQGASSQLGAAMWITLAAWMLLFLSGCAFGCGGCSGRKRQRQTDQGAPYFASYGQRPGAPPRNDYAEQMRMEALDAEADRKRRQQDWDRNNSQKNDLPKFAEYQTEYTVPLKNDYEDGNYASPLPPQHRQQPSAVSGVGEGYGRRQPSANTYNVAAAHENTAGHGAHAIRSANISPGPPSSMLQPMNGSPAYPPSQAISPTSYHPNPNEAYYTPGVGPQPFRDETHQLSPPSRNYSTSSPATPAPRSDMTPSMSLPDAYGGMSTAPADTRPTLRPSGTDYSGATFGMQQYGHAMAGSTSDQYPVYDPASSSGFVQRQPSEASGGTRMHSIPTSPVDPQTRSHDGYDNYSSSVYDHHTNQLQQHYQDAREPLQNVSGHGYDSSNSYANTSNPPGYESFITPQHQPFHEKSPSGYPRQN